MREHDRGRRDGASARSLAARDAERISRRGDNHWMRANERPPTDDASTLLSRAAYEQAKTTESYRRFVRATVSYYAAAIAMGEVLQRVSADVKDFVLDGTGGGERCRRSLWCARARSWSSRR